VSNTTPKENPMNLVIICERHNYRDVPVYELSGDTPECMSCINEQDAEQAAWLAYCDSRSQCNMCIAGGDCYRHGYQDEQAEEPTSDERLRFQLTTPIFHGRPLGGVLIYSPNYCDDCPPF
jgi:hypothetical protein